MMKKLIVWVLLLSSFTVIAGKSNLKLHYTFEKTGEDGVITDASGNGYNATLKNQAYIDKMSDYSVLNLGYDNGYLDMGDRIGELICSLQDFTVSAIVCVDDFANLSSNGNFIWSFSNSNNIASDRNGCMFFSAKNQSFSITKTDFSEESTISVGAPMKKKTWTHVVYTQNGDNATIYMDGKVIKSGTIPINPTDIGATTNNFLGRSPYRADSYFKGVFADFRVYNEVLSQKEISKLSKELPAMNELVVDYFNKPKKFVSTGNPLLTHKHTADPAALVYNDTFYLYAGEDVGDGSGYNIPNWVVFSSTDLKNWKEYPVPLSVSDIDWAQGNTAWAAQVIEKDDKFYWYITTENKTKRGMAIGVMVSDSPTGPFVDARGTALVTNDMTTKWTGISWDDIDPTVWIDDDGQAYLFWGNTQCYYAKLKDNMIEFDSEIMPVDLNEFTEAPWIHKKDEWYYLSYASQFPEKTCYAMSKNINGPWEYKGILNELAGNCNTNHQAIVEYKGKWYFVYHNGGVQPKGGSFLRSVCIDYLYYNEDGSLKRIQMTSEGVDQIKE